MLPTYNGVLLQFEDHFQAWVPDVMGAYACGATAEEASSEVREQLYTVLMDLSRSGCCTFPQPSSASLAQRKARNLLLELQELGEAPQVVLSQTTLVVTPHYQAGAAAGTSSSGVRA